MRTVARITDAPRRVVAKLVGPESNDPGGGGGSGGNAGGPFFPASDVLISTVPTSPFARWTGTGAARTEGDGIIMEVELNRPVSTPRVLPITLDVSSTIDPLDVTFPSEIFFQFGQKTAQVEILTNETAAGGSTKTCILKLDPEGVTSSELPIVETQPNYGPDTFTLTVTNAVGSVTPTWTLRAGATSIPEGSGVQLYEVTLDAPALDEVRIAVSVGSGTTATLNTDYLAFATTVVIPAGEQVGLYRITFPDNAIDAPVDPVLVVQGAYVSGTVTSTTTQTFSTTILDNDDNGASSQRRVTFIANQLPTSPGGTALVSARIVDGNGVPASFQTRTVIPITRGLSSGAVPGDFIETWGSNEAFSITFEPEAETTSFSVAVAAAAGAGEYVEYVIQSAPAGEWIVGARDTVRVVANSGVTKMLVPAMSGGTRRMIQGMVAVSPPSTTLPDGALSNGETVQLVGLKRNGAGEWISAYFYGFDDSTESRPDVDGGLEYRLATSSDAAPAEAGTFSPTFAPEVSFAVTASNVGVPYECSTAVSAADLAPIWWTRGAGSNPGVFPQTGPEVVRERVYRMRPVKQGVTPAAGLTSGDALGVIELCEKRIAGESEVFLYEGRFLNGAWSAAVDPLDPNPYVDGEVNIQSIVVTLPSGYVIEFGDVSPVQDGNGTDTASLLKNRAEDYFIKVNASYTFWFAVVATSGGADAVSRAQGYIRCQNIAWAVGELGSTRQPISGEASELTVDWERAGFRDGSLNGWRAIKNLGDEQGSIVRSQWASGGGDVLGTRLGWLMGLGPQGKGGPGGDLIDGSQALIPWWGWWYRLRMSMCAVAGRNNVGYVDVNTGERGWWWAIARDTSSGFKVPFLGPLFEREGTRRHWHFNTVDNCFQGDLHNVGNYLDYILGPTSRDWNTPSVADPNEANIRGGGFGGYPCEVMTHSARWRVGIDQTWEACRLWTAYATREDLVAYVSRIFSPVDCDNIQVNQFDRDRTSTSAIVSYLTANPTLLQKGVCLAQNNSQGVVQAGFDIRAYGWASYHLQGFYAIAPDALRTRMRGQETTDTRGNDLLGGVWSQFNAMTTPGGVLGRANNSNARPDPFLWFPGRPDPNPNYDSYFAEPNFVTRSGAAPHVDQYPTQGTALGDHFHQVFWQHSLLGWKRHVWAPGSTQRSLLDRALRYHDYYIRGSQAAISAAGRDLSMPYMLAVCFGPVPLAGPGGPEMSGLTAQQVIDGEAAWRYVGEGSGEDAGWGNHFNKSGWSTTAAVDGLNDDSLLYIARNVWGRLDDDDAQFIQHVMDNGILRGMTQQQSGYRRKIWGEWTFMIPHIAALLNRVS